MVLAYIIFFLAGLGFGYAAPGIFKFTPFVFPLLLALGALLRDGLQGEIALRLLIALGITAVGVVIGRLLDTRGQEPAAT
jgi:hypothetical protein